MAHIYSITYQPMEQEYENGRLDYFIRVSIPTARLIADFGMEGDRKAGHQPIRQLNLLSQEWLTQLKPQGYKTEPGQFGEQLIVTGLDFASLQPGDRLQLGSEVVIEITKPRNGCERLEMAQEKSIQGIGPIGLLAKVVVGGMISVGNTVQVEH